jgi:hypothetical protein
MNIQTLTFIDVSEEAYQVIALGKKHHWRFRIIPDFKGIIETPIFNSKGDWLYMPLRETDKVIIPKSAYQRHAVIEKTGVRVAQVIIGHEVEIATEKPLFSPKPTREINLEKIAEVAAKGFLAGITGITTVAFYAIAGVFLLVDPSYCIVLDDEAGTVVELVTWHVEG